MEKIDKTKKFGGTLINVSRLRYEKGGRVAPFFYFIWSQQELKLSASVSLTFSFKKIFLQ
ncbi:hypothetical protein FUAX_32020 [Fulvitalea axinellae]|uniref:Uncharacterized protein n=1 Tax=Fulvitalea axinellae TaxID=1182444 RepID=A0AAU9DE66_9BACT|nr:hypothetical protein FUAX_32020 [Fulvitalea axinellae]